MAISNEQVLAAISTYRAEHQRPCPARYLVDLLGEEALDVVAALKKDGTLVGKRGRTGGLVPAGDTTASASSEDSATDTTTDSGESLADQFAALAAQLANSESEAAVG
jgi:hypothetical protein